jgi:hypothetical protein
MNNKLSYVRPLGNYHYPRFHIYIENNPQGELILNLHLDQKSVSYGRQTAHSGEYDDETVKQEGERLKIFLNLKA